MLNPLLPIVACGVRSAKIIFNLRRDHQKKNHMSLATMSR